MNFRVLRKVNPGVCGNILRSVCLVNAFRKWVTEFWNALSQRGRAFRADHRLSCYCSPRGALASQPGNLSGIHGDAGSAKALTVCVRIPQTTRTRSTMRLRSNSATAPRTVNIILPVGVVVPNSMACRRYRIHAHRCKSRNPCAQQVLQGDDVAPILGHITFRFIDLNFPNWRPRT